MGFKSSSSAALFLSLNLFFFACALASEYVLNNDANVAMKHIPATTLSPRFRSKPALTASKPAHNEQPMPSLSKCSRDTLKLGACTKLLNGPINVVIGRGTSKPCCALIDGLIGAQVGVCLCTALKANVLGIELDVNVALRVLVNTCGKRIPRGFKCA